MTGFASARGFTRSAALILCIGSFLSVRSAHAFAPEAAAAIARQAAGVLPPAARWGAGGADAASAAVLRRLENEALDPEATVDAHCFDADHWTSTDAPAGAPASLAAAREALRQAFLARDPQAVTAAIADLCVSAADLADPFQVTSPDRDEVPGARAQFSDLFETADLAGLSSPATSTAGDPLSAGITLALQSAASRHAIEDAARNRDDATVAVVRRGRLEAALSVAQAITLEAWHAAGEPALDGGSTPLLRAWPNPARGPVTLAFTLPASGRVRVELLDVAGRRCWVRDLDLAAGPQQLQLPGAATAALAPGVYLARIAAPRAMLTGRVIRGVN